MVETYLNYSPDVEVRHQDEDKLIAEILAMMASMGRCAFERHRHAIRGVHSKSHGFLKGELTIPELPPHLRQGIFSSPATYPVVIRLSSAPGEIDSDEIPAPRGLAMKVIGVKGGRLLPNDSGHNQDFLMVNVPALAFGTVETYRQLLGLVQQNAQSPAFLQRAMAGAARGIEAVVEAAGIEPGATLRGLARDNHHLLGETYHTMAAIRFGDHIAKISAAPLSENVKALTGKDAGAMEYSTMRDLVVAHFHEQGAEYQLRAQLCTDLERMPVEDAAVLWPEEVSPHQPIATLRIPAQDPWSPPRRVYGDDVLSFNPWHGIEEHRPLGSIMRLRIPVYEQSTQFRHEMNARQRIEPTSIAEIPD